MIVKNAIKKLSKYGKVEMNGIMAWAQIGDRIVSFHASGEWKDDAFIVPVHVKRVGEEEDSRSGYYPGSYFDNLTQAIRYALSFKMKNESQSKLSNAIPSPLPL